MSVIEQLSGVVLNQNGTPGLSDFYTPSSTSVYQEFFLPKNYTRGSDNEELFTPDLSGFQLAAEVLQGTESTVTFDWAVEYQVFGLGWLAQASGTIVGAHTYGSQVWMNVLFDNPIPIDATKLAARWRIKLTGGPSKIWYSAPNPLATTTAVARAADGYTALTRPSDGAQYSFLFRVLGLTADDGIDFLGNPYRSGVITQGVGNTDTRDGGNADKYWLSKPNPSRFAVESLYFDVRPESAPTYNITNYIPNPSVEIGLTGIPVFSGATLTQDATWFTSGAYSVRSRKVLSLTGAYQSGGGVQLASIPVTPSTNYCFQADSNVISAYGGGVKMSVEYRDATNTTIAPINFKGPITPATGIKQIVFNTISPPGAANVVLTIYMDDGAGPAGTAEFLVDSILFAKGVGPLPYADGDTPGYIWANGRSNSQTVQVVSPDTESNLAVIDRVLLDPLTPGMYFHIYSSSEGDPGTTEDEWENKLWEPVHKSFKADKRDTYALPAPVSARYIKVEFSHLQAKHYAPGNFAKPITYKKHPAWVLDYFLGRLESEKAVENNLGVQRIGIVYNALDIAYNYYLDDLNQEPDQPVEYSTGKPVTVGSDQVDTTTLEKINLTMNPYREGPLAFAKTEGLLGLVLKQTAAQVGVAYPSESNAPPGSPAFVELQALRDESVVFENDYPVMFFYLTCRHGYRVLTAEFSHDRAYFAGVNEIAFTRDNYTTAHDNDQYIEPGADLQNIERNDFVSVDGSLVL